MEALEANDWASVGGGGGLLGALDELGDGPGGAQHDDDDDDNEQLNFENMNFGFDKDDLEGLRKAIWKATREREEEEGGDPSSSSSNSNSQDKPAAANQQQQGAAGAVGEAEEGQYDDEIRKVEQMMQKLQAVRDMSAGLPEEQRKRMAAKAVGEVMRDL